MVDGIPERLQALVFDIVAVHKNGRALVLSVDDAAMLREHGLITFVNKPTPLGECVARNYRSLIKEV